MIFKSPTGRLSIIIYLQTALAPSFTSPALVFDEKVRREIRSAPRFCDSPSDVQRISRLEVQVQLRLLLVVATRGYHQVQHAVVLFFCETFCQRLSASSS